MTFSLTTASRCKGFKTFRDLILTPSSQCAGGLIAQKPMTGVQLWAVYNFVWPAAGWNATVWLVGVDKIPLHLACAIYWWLWRVFHRLLSLSLLFFIL
jgi:hypothetical protein